MSFSESKTQEYKKLATAYIFNYFYDGDLIPALQICEDFKENKDFEVNKENRVRIKKLDFDSEKKRFFVQVTSYEPNSFIPITPPFSNEPPDLVEGSEIQDLKNIENCDKNHMFIMIDEKNIYAISQITYSHQAIRLNKIFKLLGFELNIRDKVDKGTVNRVRKEKIRSLGIAVKTTAKDIEEFKIKSKISLFEKEDSNTPFYGTLTLDHKNNLSLINEATDNLEDFIDELSEDFFIVTQKGNIIKSSAIKTKKDYYTYPYGSKTIKDTNAKEILDSFISTIIR
ncbi:hypothetical protein [Budvicia aquatica]|uniref:Uncharacterized protein n=1 Tax=Budvicia aquatica TaxID=82979 RepID=A0A2C6CWY5_9GAMM|nr:hypothetical protein [Budvicia aquatica]PHI31189.1 hypothetical protein CRN84_18515 [Budvicia aquatica]VFS51450.1 Uncharacterised protein [Budvicia aquatica]